MIFFLYLLWSSGQVYRTERNHRPERKKDSLSRLMAFMLLTLLQEVGSMQFCQVALLFCLFVSMFLCYVNKT